MANSVFIWPGFFTSNGTTINPLLPLALPDGSASAPSLTFASETTLGAYRSGAASMGFVADNTVTFRRATTGNQYVGVTYNSNSTGGVLTFSDAAGTAADLFFGRDAANTSVQRNGTNTQQFNLGPSAAYLFFGKGNSTSSAFFGTVNASAIDFYINNGIVWNLTTGGNWTDAGSHTITAGSTIAAGGLTPAGTVGTPVVTGYGDVAAATNTGTASIATFTVGASDRTFEVGANCLITTSTTHSFSLDCTYTDESNVARTLVLPVTGLTATFLTNGLMTNVTGAGPYESAVMTIRAKAATVITVRTSAGGTFTTVVYNARGVIKQVS